MTMLRADMHVHTCYSRYNDNIAFLGARDCYSTPEQVYAKAKARGMDLVAITDHDSIEGALALVEATRNAPDVIVGEEVSCWYPNGSFQVHLGVYGMTEALHRDIQPLRRNVVDVIACLQQAGVFFCLNHLMHFWQEHESLDRYLQLLTLVPGLEVRNGTMVPKHNRLSEKIVNDFAFGGGRRLAAVAGSDAHTLRRVGTTWTEAPGRTREEFLDSVRRGLGTPAAGRLSPGSYLPAAAWARRSSGHRSETVDRRQMRNRSRSIWLRQDILRHARPRCGLPSREPASATANIDPATRAPARNA